SISTLTRGDIAVNNNVATGAGGIINITSSDDINVQAGATSINSGAGGIINLRVDNNNNVVAQMDLGGSTLNAATINLTGGTGGGNDTLIGQNVANTWVLSAG